MLFFFKLYFQVKKKKFRQQPNQIQIQHGVVPTTIPRNHHPPTIEAITDPRRETIINIVIIIIIMISIQMVQTINPSTERQRPHHIHDVHFPNEIKYQEITATIIIKIIDRTKCHKIIIERR